MCELCNTPDLSAFSGSLPKIYKAKKTPKPLKKTSKKVDEWTTARGELKKLFEANGTIACELNYPKCWKKNALGFAHIAKRRELGIGELKSVILACNSCHQIIEQKPHAEMRKIIGDIIENRGW